MENWLVAVRFTSEDNFQNNIQRQRQVERIRKSKNGCGKKYFRYYS